MAVRFGLCCIFSVVSLLLPGSHGYFVTVDAHAMECFFDKVTTGMKMSLMFEVVEGGFLDIDVEVCHMTIILLNNIYIYTDYGT